jgi:hypothetical protein
VPLDHLLEREAPIDDRAQPSRIDEAAQVGGVVVGPGTLAATEPSIG